jgi:low molecular weight protein-tyrosine phosphatase
MKDNAYIPAKSVLFVCLGNICRSPIAEGVFRHIASKGGRLEGLRIDSAGLGSWHVGQPPDSRAQDALASRGIDISDLRARQVTPQDFEEFDLILAMDKANRQGLMKLAPKDKQHKIRLFMDCAPHFGVHEIPDPFFGDKDSFDYVVQLIDAASRGLMRALTAKPPAGATATTAPTSQAQAIAPASRPLAPLNG